MVKVYISHTSLRSAYHHGVICPEATHHQQYPEECLEKALPCSHSQFPQELMWELGICRNQYVQLGDVNAGILT